MVLVAATPGSGSTSEDMLVLVEEQLRDQTGGVQDYQEVTAEQRIAHLLKQWKSETIFSPT